RKECHRTRGQSELASAQFYNVATKTGQPKQSRETSDHMRDYNAAVFVKSVAQLMQLPADDLAEVAFAGRSNAGKSSALNAITGRRAIARTSRTPGRTQLLNFFALPCGMRLVDLPGYGYAEVPLAVRKEWAALVEGYLR